MKKVLSLLLFVFLSSALVAQNTVTVTQTGNSNSATATQTGSNIGEIEQIGDGNNGTITQDGTNTWANVWQYGNSNAGTVTQDGTNDGWVDQINGDGNSATVVQDGSGNSGGVTQGMIEGYQSVSTDMPSNNNIGTINQLGDNNGGYATQIGDGNGASIDQQGNGNTAYIYNGWAYGFWGETAVTSALSNTNSSVSIEQISDDNYAAAWQYGGDNDEVVLSQNGLDNTASISQGFIYEDANYDFTTPVYNTVDNYASVSQTGDGNYGKAFQLGDGNSFTLSQTGNGNMVGYDPLASGLEAVRNAYFAQDGNDNTFEGEQDGGAVLDAGSFQFGDGNGIDMMQGSADVALIQQTGDLNTVTLTQGGGGQDATILQTGNSNNATVTQN